MSKKTKTKSQSTVVSTPTNPEWVTGAVSGLQDRINGLLDVDAGGLVPGASPLQQRAFGAASRLLGPERSATGGGGMRAAMGALGSAGDGYDPANYPTRDVDTSNFAVLARGPAGTPVDAAGFPSKAAARAAGAPVGRSIFAPPVDTSVDTSNWRGGNAAAQQAASRMTADGANPQATSRSLLDVDLDAYQNPWLDSVVGSSLAGYDERRGMEEAEMRAQQARNQKFSGSGDAIRRAMFDRGTLQDRTGIEADLRAQGFDRATSLATSDLNREAETSRFNTDAGLRANDARLRAAGLLGDLSNSQATNERADLGLLGDLGNVEREIDREKLGAEVELLRLVSGLNANQPYNLFRGETQTGNSTSTTKTSDPMGTIGGLMQGAGALFGGMGQAGFTFSDKRLKADIETVGRDRSGRRLVSFRYKGEPEGVRRVGHIAQEVRKTDPHAVRKVAGHYGIDYGLLGDV